jgi:opacity protein-like surface antigen
MKRMLLGLVAIAALMLVPAAADAGHGHHDRWYGSGYGHSGYRGGCNDYDYHHHHYRAYRRPVIVGSPFYAPYYGPRTSFYYSGPNASFGFGY